MLHALKSYSKLLLILETCYGLKYLLGFSEMGFVRFSLQVLLQRGNTVAKQLVKLEFNPTDGTVVDGIATELSRQA